MTFEQKKGAMRKAIKEAVTSVDKILGGKFDRDLDKNFLKNLRGQMKKRAEMGKPLTHEDLSEVEKRRLEKIAKFAPDLTEEELDVIGELGSSKRDKEKRAA